MILTPRDVEIRHFHLFCGLGGGARGFNRGTARVGHLGARFRCIGGIDVDKAAIADFERLAGAKGTVLDLFSRDQYRAFHGCEPPDGWREATPEDMRRAAGYERPHIIFGSAPCKGFSGLLSQSRANSDRYQALNQLALRGLWLALEAWKDDPPEFFLWENVPRIQTRGRGVLDQMMRLVEAYTYVATETTHDCGELGELAQSRRRFLMVARHREKVPPFLYEPPKRPLRPVGDVLGRLPLPSHPTAGPMHRMRALQWKTWVRLAFVEAGGDWRSLNKLRVENGILADYGIAPEAAWHGGVMGVTPWTEPAPTITGRAGVTTGQFSVADPRPGYTGEYAQLGVNPWDRPVGTVSGQSAPGGGAYSVADPRPQWENRYGNLAVTEWDRHANTVIAGGKGVQGGWQSVADPRVGQDGPRFNNAFRIVAWDAPAPAVFGPAGSGGQSVADPRTGLSRESGDHYLTARHYGVVPWSQPSMAITANAGHDNGAHSVADPRCRSWASPSTHSNLCRVTSWDAPAHAITGATHVNGGAPSVADPRCAVACELPAPDARLVAVIRALDNTWHRPFTTLELAALQSLVDPDEYLELHGQSDTAWRERIGNAVPSDAAMAIASVMGTTLLLAWSGETFALSATPIWVQPIAIALALHQPEAIA